VKVTGIRLPLEAVSVLAPGVEPSIQLPTLAIPEAFVACEAAVTEPPPLATVNVTITPLTGSPLASVTSTAGATATAVLTVALCPSPADFTIEAGCDAGGGVPVAVKVTGVKLPLEAVIVLLPGVEPSVQLPTVATPEAFVV
jgi:hypothetical protein